MQRSYQETLHRHGGQERPYIPTLRSVALILNVDVDDNSIGQISNMVSNFSATIHFLQQATS